MFNLSASQLAAAAQRKADSERRALEVVCELIENDISTEQMLTLAVQLSQAYYDDVVDERSISKLCGYPSCPNKLTQILPQKYKISLQKTKVYDITERKKYCSDLCFKASQHIRSQLTDNLPSAEESVRHLTALTQHSSNNTLSGAGQSVLEAPWKSLHDQLDSVATEMTNSPGPTVTRDSGLVDTRGRGDDSNSDSDSDDDIATSAAYLPSDSDDDVNYGLEATSVSDRAPLNSDKPGKRGKPHVRRVQQIEALAEKPSLVASEAGNHGNALASWATVQRVVGEWFTENTRHYLIDRSIAAGGGVTTGTADTVTLASGRRDDSEYASRVQQYLGGDKQMVKVTNKPETTLPSVQVQSVLTQQRRIVLEKLSHVWPKVLTQFGLGDLDLSTSLRELIDTFALSSTNIVLKPDQWQLVAVVIGYLLCQKLMLTTASGPIRISTTLSQYKLSEADFTSCVEKLL